ncbi:MAG TPA: diguanylate cyclase [Gaiellaceae bacterium]|nr:diguanylate cyclase [Gaiellaceae bacterium]
MQSFRVKLVLYFALLALVPAVVVFRTFQTVTTRGETRSVDARLQAGLRAARATYDVRVSRADQTARDLAASDLLQRALRARDRAAVEGLVRNDVNLFVQATGFAVGRTPALSHRTAAVADGGRRLGTVTASIPFDDELLARLRSGLAPVDELVILARGRVVTGPYRGMAVAAPRPRPDRLVVGGLEFRALAAAPVPETPDIDIVALTPEHAIQQTIRDSEQRLVLILALSLLGFGIVTYLLGRSVIGSLRRLTEGANALAQGDLRQRVDVRGGDEFSRVGESFNRMAAELQQRVAELEDERRRLRETTARFGEALQATHDPDSLARVIVETAVEATGASGGLIVDRGQERARSGAFDTRLETIAFPLRAGVIDFGSLVLSAPAFELEQLQTATSLAANAVIALENARLHRIVERQALVDPLTELANRRVLEETLHAELARAVRFGGDVCLVITDLDGFKEVNDRWGHPSGDIVLRAFGHLLRETVREIDLAGRWGGEEFAVIMPGTDSAGGANLAERARAALEELEIRSTDGDPIRVTASFGVASFANGESIEEIVAAADDALYRAKRAGKNRVVCAPEPVAG